MVIPLRPRRWLRVGAGVVTIALTAPLAHAADATARFALEPLQTSPAGDRFFLAPDAGVSGDRTFYAKLFGAYAYKPLLERITEDGGRDVVSSELYLDVGASYAILRRLLFSADLPVVPYEGGGRSQSAGVGDLRLGARVALLHAAHADLGIEARVWLPTGSPDALTGDGALRGSMHAATSGRVSLFAYNASVGYLARKRRDLLGESQIGPSLPFAAAFGVVLLERLQIGPEVSGWTVIGGGATLFAGRTTPVLGLLGARYRVADWVIGAGAGPGLSRAPGVAPHVVLSIAWEPSSVAKPHDAEAGEAGAADATVAPTTAPPPSASAKAPEPVQIPEPVPAPISVAPSAPPEAPPAPAPSAPAPPPPPSAPEPIAERPLDPEAARLTARQLFEEGVHAYDAGSYVEAAAIFAKAYAIKAHPAVLRNLAQAELMSGQLEAACKHFKRWRVEARGTAKDVRQVAQGMKDACR